MSYMRACAILFILAAAGRLYAQDYKVQVTSGTYKDLNPAQVIGSGEAMEAAYTLTAPFAFSPYDSLFDFESDNLIFVRNGYIGVNNPRIFWAMDAFLGNLVPVDSTSSLSVQLLGTMSGSRIMKFQWKNLRPALNPAGDFVNFQLWLYEADRSIEVRVGPSTISTRTTWNDSGPSVGMFLSTYSLETFYHQTYLLGDAASPVADHSYGSVLAPLTNLPAEGTIYRFTLAGTQGAGVKMGEGGAASLMHPNPADGFTRISLPEGFRDAGTSLHLYDALGREVKVVDDVADGSAIATNGLTPGAYFAVVVSGVERRELGMLMVR